MTSTDTPEPGMVDSGAEYSASLVIAAVIAACATIVANLVVRFIGLEIFDIPEDFNPLASAGPVVTISIIYTAVAIAAYLIILRFAARPIRTFLIVAAIAFVLSFVPMLSILSDDETTAGGIVTLSVMHVISALIIVPTLLRLGR